MRFLRYLVSNTAIACGLAGGLLLAGCSQPLDEPAYRAYLLDPEHGLTQQTTAGAATVTCTYRPTELLVAQELHSSELPATTQVLDSLRRAYAGKTYIALDLSLGGTEIENQFVNDKTRFTQAVTYLNTGIAADVLLTGPGQQPVAAVAASYPRQYGNTGRSSLLLVFDTHTWDIRQGFELTFRDQYFGLGSPRFVFKADDVAALPVLKYN
ncbi:hypothetical protein [Hymenobacter chitinivorans]|uniref:Uncharacterized protein n=1 Tax=Hymenobacter chitinivorans DSM 11115 TaxID=1121954 RepID=A0A2M9BNQ6_9BACT|nr:hypothetical protein [Hymenobacter chitinivorans]PJJ59575.1 hypothetical protein CLV45_0994 [Hymenobacter chitinivorans DSM 11115]